MEIGRYLVLSTAHVCLKTADLLDTWAVLEPSVRPLGVTSTRDGWFVPTREVGEHRRDQIPEEVLAAMLFARHLGCDYLLFDCDAGIIDALPSFPW